MVLNLSSGPSFVSGQVRWGGSYEVEDLSCNTNTLRIGMGKLQNPDTHLNAVQDVVVYRGTREVNMPVLKYLCQD